MKRLRLRAKIIYPFVFGICFLTFSLFFTRVALLHPEEINAKDDSGAWRIRTPNQIKTEGFLALATGVIFCCAGVYLIASTLNSHIFYIAGERFSQNFNQLNPTKILKVGPLIGLKDKGLTVMLHYEAPWERKLGSFRLWPEVPMMSYYVQLYGCAGNDEILIEERIFRHEEEGGEGGKYRPAWKEETFMVVQQFDEYFLKIIMNIDPQKLIWPKKATRNNALAESKEPSVLLGLRLNVTLRWKDLSLWRSKPDCSLTSAQIQLLD